MTDDSPSDVHLMHCSFHTDLGSLPRKQTRRIECVAARDVIQRSPQSSHDGHEGLAAFF